MIFLFRASLFEVPAAAREIEVRCEEEVAMEELASESELVKPVLVALRSGSVDLDRVRNVQGCAAIRYNSFWLFVP